MSPGGGDSNGGNAIVAGGSVTVDGAGISGGLGVGTGNVGGIAIMAGGNISLEGERIVEDPNIYYSCWVRGGAGDAESGISIKFSGDSSSPRRFLTTDTALVCRIGGTGVAPAPYTIYMQNNDVAIMKDSCVGFSADITLPLFNGGATPYALAGGSDNDTIDLDDTWFGPTDVTVGNYTNWSYNKASNTITVTDDINVIGTVTAASATLNLNIRAGATVKWAADYSCSLNGPIAAISLSGSGAFEVVNGKVQNNGSGSAILITGSPTPTITVSGGTVESTTGNGINTGGNVEVSDGTVSNNGSASTIDADGNVEVSGATTLVKNTGSGIAIRTISAGATVTVSGGAVTATTGTAIDAASIAVTGTASVSVTGANPAIKLANNANLTLSGSGNLEVRGGTGRVLKLSGTGKVIFTDDNQVLELYNNSANDEVINLSQLSANLPWDFDDTNSYISSGTGNAADITLTLPAGYVQYIALNSDRHYILTTASALASGKVGTAYSAAITAAVGDYIDVIGNFIISDGDLPDGLDLNASSGMITGTPTTAGTYDFVIYVEGAPSGGGGTWSSAPVQYSLTINPAGPGPGGTTTTNASITQTKADFDKSGGKDINVNLSNGSYTLQSLKNGSYTLKEGAWYYDDVMFVYENGLMTGTSADKFSPENALTRGMIVTILYRHAGEPDVSGLTNPFNDVAEGQWYTDAVKWAADSGIVEGYGNGKFGPDDNITRQDLAVILVRYADFAGIGLSATHAYPGFSDDADIAGYAKSAVERLFKAGIINGKTGNLFDPQGTATRAEVAAIFARFLKAVK